jgi:NhaP-type Na+/H+ or K+/H+ antiporter
MDAESPHLIFALALGTGVLGHIVARHLRIPSIVPLIALGIVIGPDLLHWIEPRGLGDGLFAIVELGVAIILFEGGLNLDLGRLRREGGPIRNLVTVGALVTAAGAAVAAHFLMGWSWELSIIFGTLVIVTGPTVIGPLLRNTPVRPRLATVLEAEGVLIDPIGAIIAAVTLQVVVGAHATLSPGLQGLLLRLGFGALAGLGFGFALAGLLRWRRAVPEGLENIVSLGGALVLFAGCNALVSDTGILAVVVAGTVVGNVRTRVSRELREFQEQLTIGMIGLLFVLLAADVRIDDVLSLGSAGVATVGALILVVRPLNVWVSTLSSELDPRERAFLSWIAPRGIVAAAVASLFAGVMDSAGMPGGAELRALVFLTIAVTVLLQGISAGFVAGLLGVRAPGRDGIAILGADELALVLGSVLVEHGTRVVFLDSNPAHIRAAEERGFQAIYGNALEERTLSRARLEHIRAAIGLTPNDEINGIFAREAAEEFSVPETYVAINRRATRYTESRLERQGSHTLFDRPKDVERWSVRVRQEVTDVYRYVYHGDPSPAEEEDKNGGLGGFNTDPYILLATLRGELCRPMHAGADAREGDVAFVLVFEPELEEADETLSAEGWVRMRDGGG